MIDWLFFFFFGIALNTLVGCGQHTTAGQKDCLQYSASCVHKR